LSAAEVVTQDPIAAVKDPKVAGACMEVAARARQHFDEAGRIMGAAPRAVVRAPRLMAAAYGSILDEMVAAGFKPPRRRAHVSRLQILAAFFWYGII
jgi:phytoene/squalene synthetase